MSIKSDAGLLWFCFTSLCDWSKKLVSQSQPIKCKTKTKHDLVTRVFPRFKEVACFYSVFSLANNHGNLFFWLAVVITTGFGFSMLNWKVLDDWQLWSIWIWWSSCDQFRFGHSIEIRFLRIQCCISVCMYTSYKVTKAIPELQVD